MQQKTRHRDVLNEYMKIQLILYLLFQQCFLPLLQYFLFQKDQILFLHSFQYLYLFVLTLELYHNHLLERGEKYLLSGQWRSLKEITTLITKITGAKTTSLVMPFWVANVGLPFITLYSKIFGNQPLYTGESLHIIKNGNRNISNQKAINELGFHPRRLEETLTDLFKWFKDDNIIN